MILNIIAKRFISGENPVSASELSKSIQIPVRLAREILYNLNAAGLITEINIEKPRDRLYQPAMDTGRMTMEYVLSRIDKVGGEDLPVKQTSEYKKLNHIITEFGEKLKKSDINLLIGEI